MAMAALNMIMLVVDTPGQNTLMATISTMIEIALTRRPTTIGSVSLGLRRLQSKQPTNMRLMKRYPCNGGNENQVFRGERSP